MAIFRTVFVDAELFNEDRELRRLVRDPLRSTSIERLLFEPLSIARTRNEFVRLGVTVLRVFVDAKFVVAARSDRLRAKLSRFRSSNDFTDDFAFVPLLIAADAVRRDGATLIV